MNTKINLAYQSENLSKSMTVILNGAMTQAQANQISDSLTMDHCLICSQVGLPSPLEAALNAGEIDSVTEYDHAWTRLEDWAATVPLVEDLHTTQNATINLSPEELADAMLNQRWNLLREIERLGIPEFDLEQLPQNLLEFADHGPATHLQGADQGAHTQ